MSSTASLVQANGEEAIQRYYRRHAPIYDLTRWTYLFGRADLLRRLSSGPAPRHIIEIGCGTGANLAVLGCRFPGSRLTGIDLSADMLAKAGQKLSPFGARVCLLRQSFETPIEPHPACDLIVFSYSLSMMYPAWHAALKAAQAQLKSDGRVAVVDFAGTPWNWYRRWMFAHHVHLDDGLIPKLTTFFQPLIAERRRAFGGAWRYVLFIGAKTKGG